MASFLAELGQGQEPNRSGNSKHTHKIRNLRIGRTCDVRDVADRPYDAKNPRRGLIYGHQSDAAAPSTPPYWQTEVQS